MRERSLGTDRNRSLLLRELGTLQTLLQDLKGPQISSEGKSLRECLCEWFDACTVVLTQIEAGQTRIETRTLQSLERLRSCLARLGQKMTPLDRNAGRVAVLTAVIQQWTELGEAYVKLSNSEDPGVQATLSQFSEVQTFRVQSEELQTNLAYQEVLHSDRTRELQKLRHLLVQQKNKLQELAQETTIDSLRFEHLQKKLAQLNDEIQSTRESLLEVKEEINSSRKEGTRLEQELDTVRSVFSQKDLHTHIEELRSELASLHSRESSLHTEIEGKKTQQQADLQTIEELEARIKANRQSSAESDVAQKMQSMQATLHDLLSTLGNASDSDDQLDLDTALE